MKPHGTATENLMDVLQALQLARRTGMLVVERYGSDNAIEQGNIMLHNGQVIDASVGPYVKGAAMNILLKWNKCYFVLQPLSAAGGTSAPTLRQPTQRSPGHMPVPDEERYAVTPPDQIVPLHVWAVDEVLPHFPTMKLSRLHRQLFLLIDGRRPVYELIRLIGRKPYEVQVLLTDLLRLGLIKYK